MRRWIAMLVLLSPVAALAQAPDCFLVEAEARYGSMAYDHYVRITNRCDREIRCRVSTDANPAVQIVDVPAREAREVITFRGSPAREFTPSASCVPRLARTRRSACRTNARVGGHRGKTRRDALISSWPRG
jgi:hypothetical protein